VERPRGDLEEEEGSASDVRSTPQVISIAPRSRGLGSYEWSQISVTTLRPGSFGGWEFAIPLYRH
jgi:hypothetical protein